MVWNVWSPLPHPRVCFSKFLILSEVSNSFLLFISLNGRPNLGSCQISKLAWYHYYVSVKQVIIGSGNNGLSPAWRQAITWINDDFSDSNVGWPNVGPTSVLSSWRWANVSITDIAVWVVLNWEHFFKTEAKSNNDTTTTTTTATAATTTTTTTNNNNNNNNNSPFKKCSWTCRWCNVGSSVQDSLC